MNISEFVNLVKISLIRKDMPWKRFHGFGYGIPDTHDTFHSLYDKIFIFENYSVDYWEEFPFDLKLLHNDPIDQLDFMVKNGLVVETVTDGWANWEFDNDGVPIRETCTPIDGSTVRELGYRNIYQFFDNDKNFVEDDSGLFSYRREAYIEAVWYFIENKSNFFKKGFV